VREAAEHVREARARSSTVRALVGQGGLFQARDSTPAGVALATDLEGNRRAFVDRLRAAAVESAKNPAGQGQMFGAPLSIETLIARETSTANAPSLF
jgi:hypothetical protein